jgi:hypothetical protein
MIGSTVYIAQWTLSALYRRPGKGFPYRFSAILLGCVFFSFLFLLLVSLYWFVVCFFFRIWGDQQQLSCWLLAAGCLFILFDGSGIVLRLIRIDNFLPSFLGRRLSARLMW